MNTQPNTFTWNLMGMMNNCVYRVRIHPAVSNGALALKYEHPTLAGPALGGWMNRADAQKPVVEEVCQPSLKAKFRHLGTGRGEHGREAPKELLDT